MLMRPPELPESPRRPQSDLGTTWVSMDNVHFDFQQARIKPRCAEKISKIAAWATTEQASLTLDSHLEDPQANDFTPGLGVRRAMAVLDALVEAGVAPGRISVRPYGVVQPLCSEATETCRTLNRRVEILAKR
jgi:outer membrane protein OmpA-like peptidoglycan-associated protein